MRGELPLERVAMFAEWQGFNKSVLGIPGCQEAKLGELLGGKQMKQYAIRFPLRRAPVLHYNSEGLGSNHITRVLKPLPSAVVLAWLAYFYLHTFWESHGTFPFHTMFGNTLF